MSVDQTYSPRKAVLEQLALAHDHWSEEEQFLVGQGRVVEAEGAHQHALYVLRAYRAEQDDPKPKEPASG